MTQDLEKPQEILSMKWLDLGRACWVRGLETRWANSTVVMEHGAIRDLNMEGVSCAAGIEGQTSSCSGLSQGCFPSGRPH